MKSYSQLLRNVPLLAVTLAIATLVGAAAVTPEERGFEIASRPKLNFLVQACKSRSAPVPTLPSC